ncbi:DUF6962 family protein [Leptospira sarikeiensis]|uniref:Uncharacterized protein n=1 Tax=Leptospira sarikeiensis TaxID=2484943 RepID=A0A4R9K090_9LEPT|nr:hypothetical protein [Leptospira sarikeiensis]TGL59053.1 hypothetical protein EHQ64_16590 [Leptospira sarikeiensis]
MQISTAISDLVLAIAAAWAALSVQTSAKGNVSKKGGAYGLFLIALGAFFGVIFFLGGNWITPIYRPIVHIAGVVGVPWIGIAFFNAGLGKINPKTWNLLSLILLILAILDYLYSLGIYSTIIGGVSLVFVIVVCIRKYKGNQKTAALYGIAGALLFILSGLVIGTVGSIGPILKVDLFHYGLAAASYCLGYSLKRLG